MVSPGVTVLSRLLRSRGFVMQSIIFYSTISCDQRIYLSIAYHTMNARKGHDKQARCDLIIGLLFLIRGKVNRVRYIYFLK